MPLNGSLMGRWNGTGSRESPAPASSPLRGLHRGPPSGTASTTRPPPPRGLLHHEASSTARPPPPRGLLHREASSTARPPPPRGLLHHEASSTTRPPPPRGALPEPPPPESLLHHEASSTTRPPPPRGALPEPPPPESLLHHAASSTTRPPPPRGLLHHEASSTTRPPTPGGLLHQEASSLNLLQSFYPSALPSLNRNLQIDGLALTFVARAPFISVQALNANCKEQLRFSSACGPVYRAPPVNRKWTSGRAALPRRSSSIAASRSGGQRCEGDEGLISTMF
ncbi:unnamed protein product [Arctogadus glacialis]